MQFLSRIERLDRSLVLRPLGCRSQELRHDRALPFEVPQQAGILSQVRHADHRAGRLPLTRREVVERDTAALRLHVESLQRCRTVALHGRITELLEHLRIGQHVQAGFLGRHIDVLPLAVLTPAARRGKHRDGTVDPRHVEHHRETDLERLAIQFAERMGPSAERRNGEMVRGVVAIGACLAESGDRGDDDPRVDRCEALVSQPESLHRPRAGRLDHHVGTRDEALEVTAVAGDAEVERDAALVAIEKSLERTASSAPRSVPHRAPYPDHIGPAVREQPCTERPRNSAADVEDPQPVQTSHHAPPALTQYLESKAGLPVKSMFISAARTPTQKSCVSPLPRSIRTARRVERSRPVPQESGEPSRCTPGASPFPRSATIS